MALFKTKSCVQILLATCALAGCAGTTIQSRHDHASSIAATAHLTRADIASPPFILASWQKITQPGSPANIYIEGDGLAWMSRSTPSLNPTPKMPLALNLAAADPAPNVIYIARPCQFTELNAPGNNCTRAYWTGKRYAPEVIESFDRALSGLARERGLTGFNLIGFSGGANVAGLLAQRRADILSLRSVAGNLDNDFFNAMHKVSPMPQSLNMADRATDLAALPQRHFIGGEDEFVPQSVFESYKKAVGPSPCIHSTVDPAAGHLDGWVEQWPTLLALPVACD